MVRFSIGYVGAWDTTDYLRLALTDSQQSVNYDYRYFCETPENICGSTAPNSTDCIRIREYTLIHNTSYVHLKFSALTTETDPSVQFWGVKELIVAAKMCHAYCLTCYGASNSNCLSCASGYYLQGNVCLPECENHLYTVVDARLCLSICPAKYYPTVDSITRQKQCLACAEGCAMCSSASVCMAW